MLFLIKYNELFFFLIEILEIFVLAGGKAKQAFRSVWFSYLVVCCIKRRCCVFQHSVVSRHQVGRHAISNANYVPTSQTNICMS